MVEFRAARASAPARSGRGSSWRSCSPCSPCLRARWAPCSGGSVALNFRQVSNLPRFPSLAVSYLVNLVAGGLAASGTTVSTRLVT